jgi:hypothetical protein
MTKPVLFSLRYFKAALFSRLVGHLSCKTVNRLFVPHLVHLSTLVCSFAQGHIYSSLKLFVLLLRFTTAILIILWLYVV